MKRSIEWTRHGAGTLVWLAMTVPWVIGSVSAQQDFSSELPRIPPTRASQTLETFSVAEGFQISLVAAEPLVTSPVAMEWDADGMLFVCEMRGYSEDRDDAISRITRLEDTDGDGVYDRSSVYADGLLWPTALFPFDGGLFVGDAPDLYYFKDTNGDGRADVKNVVLTGFETSNVQGLFNSFRWGLDNRIHVACSSVGGMVRRPSDRPDTAINVRGRDLAFNPRTYEFELTSGGAQHGMCFDDWGRKFMSSNSDHIQQVMYEDHYVARNPAMAPPRARVSIAADGPQAEVYRSSPIEPWRIVRTRLRVSGEVRGPIEGGGRAGGYFSGATGVTIYRGDAWPASELGVAVIGDVGSNLIHRKRLELEGVTFVAQRIDEASELVTSSDIWFRPAQFANAPDGSLHVIDVYREVIEHPRSLPPEIKQHLDLTSGRERGRLYRIAPPNFLPRPSPMLNQLDTPELVALLEHANAWHRETAARLIYQRQDPSSVAALKTLAQESKSPLARMHAMYSLDGLGELGQADVIARLADEHPQVRRHAIRLSETFSSSQRVQELWAQRVEDPSLEVRYQLAFSLGSLDVTHRIALLVRLLRQDIDSESLSEWMQMAVQSSLGDGAGEMFAALVSDSGFRSTSAGSFLKKLAAQIQRQQRLDDLKIALASAGTWSAKDADFALPIVGELLRHGRTSDDDPGFEESLTSLRKVLDEMVLSATLLATDDSVPLPTRLAALRGLEFGTLDQVQGSLTALIDHRQSEPLQRAAITVLGKFRSPELASPVLDAWQTLSPQLREIASEFLFARPERTVALFDAIDAGEISVGEFGKSRLQHAATSTNQSIQTRAIRYLESLGSQSRDEIVNLYRESLELTGDLDRGRQVFLKHCAACHKVDGVGHEIGPNLASMSTRGEESILVNVLDPNREVNPQYVGYIVLTEDGRAITGMISGESANSITLRRAESESDEILRSDVQRIQNTGLSIMPEGLEEVIDQQAMADLIRYLMTIGS